MKETETETETEKADKIRVRIESLKENYSVEKEVSYEEYWKLKDAEKRFKGIAVMHAPKGPSSKIFVQLNSKIFVQRN